MPRPSGDASVATVVESPRPGGRILAFRPRARRARPEWPTGEWWWQAACQGTDPNTFYPVGDDEEALSRTAAAKEICAGCPVRAACLRYAMCTNQRFGIFGGLSEQERRALRTRKTPQLRPAPPLSQ